MTAAAVAIYTNLNAMATSCDHLADELNDLVTIVDTATIVVDSVLIAGTGILAATTGPVGAIVGAVLTGGALAATAYYFAEVRPAAEKTEHFARDLAVFVRDVSEDIQQADALVEALFNSALNELPAPLQPYAQLAKNMADAAALAQVAGPAGQVGGAADKIDKIADAIDL
jgi:hypothetical protein